MGTRFHTVITASTSMKMLHKIKQQTFESQNTTILYMADDGNS